MIKTNRYLFVLVLVGCFHLSQPASAKKRNPRSKSAKTSVPIPLSPKAEATQLYREAVPEAKQGTRMIIEGNALLSKALVKFWEAARLFPSFKIDLNIGGTLDVLGHPDQSALYFEKFLVKSAKAPPEIISKARARLDELRTRLASVKVVSAVKDAAVMINGEEVGRVPMQLPHYVEPGSYILAVQHPDHVSQILKLALKKGDHLLPEVSLKSLAQLAQERKRLQQQQDLRRSKSIWGYSALAASAALALGAVVLYGVGGAQGFDAHDSFNQTSSIVDQQKYALEVESSKELVIGGHVMISAAVAAAGVSLYLLLTRPKEAAADHHPKNSPMNLGIAPTRNGAQLSLGGSF